jgi:hypothetical protein
MKILALGLGRYKTVACDYKDYFGVATDITQCLLTQVMDSIDRVVDFLGSCGLATEEAAVWGHEPADSRRADRHGRHPSNRRTLRRARHRLLGP